MKHSCHQSKFANWMCIEDPVLHIMLCSAVCIGVRLVAFVSKVHSSSSTAVVLQWLLHVCSYVILYAVVYNLQQRQILLLTQTNANCIIRLLPMNYPHTILNFNFAIYITETIHVQKYIASSKKKNPMRCVGLINQSTIL